MQPAGAWGQKGLASASGHLPRMPPQSQGMTGKIEVLGAATGLIRPIKGVGGRAEGSLKRERSYPLINSKMQFKCGLRN